MSDALEMNRNPFEDAKQEIAKSKKVQTKQAFIPKSYKATVVSLLPYETPPEEKPHILPSTFRIPVAPKGGLAVLHVGEGRYNVPNHFDDRNIPVVVSPDEMARSIVEDFVSAQIALDEGAGPGLFWVKGELSVEDVLSNYPEEVEAARARQKKWFQSLVSLADADFTKNRNRLSISDIQKAAAREMNITREWVDFTPQELMKCPFCMSAISPEAVKCQVCNEIVNKEKYKEMVGA